MKKKLLSFFLILSIVSLETFAQKSIFYAFQKPIEILTHKKLKDEIKKEEIYFLVSVSENKIPDSKSSWQIDLLSKNGEKISIDLKYLKDFEVNSYKTTEEIWDTFLIRSDFFGSLTSKGMQYDLRNSLFEDATEYYNRLENSGNIFEDAFFEDYMYGLLSKIHPSILSDGRPGNLYIKILKNPEPNAVCLPNGTILITTGLLSSIDSEDELVAILCHEVAHFVLDHSILNYNKESDRKKRAEFWASFATAVAATADILMASNNKDHPVGLLTINTAIAASIISSEILTKLGIKYNKDQEFTADWVARSMLKHLKYDEQALNNALKRIKNHLIITGNFLALTGNGSHPDMELRLQDDTTGIDNLKFTQPNYLKKVSLINSFNAQNELWGYAHHEKALELVNKNITNNIATDIDYIIKSVVLRRMYNTKEKNEESLNLILKAKSLGVTNEFLISKEEGITLLRLGRNLEAKKAFENYLLLYQQYVKKIESDNISYNDNYELEFSKKEIDWAKKMIFKAGQL
jgi:hypothetical protein